MEGPDVALPEIAERLGSAARPRGQRPDDASVHPLVAWRTPILSGASIQGGRSPANRDSGARHADPFSVNKSPDRGSSGARFKSVDSCKQKLRIHRLQVAPTMNQSQLIVVRDSKDLTMSAVINRGGGRPSKGLRKYIGFRTPAKTAEDVHMIAAAKGMTVTDYVASAVDRSLREDLALLDQFNQQEELPIRMAS